MLKLESLVDQVEKFYVMGRVTSGFDVYLPEDDFLEAYKQYLAAQNCTYSPPSLPFFRYSSQNMTFYFNRKDPDYTDGSHLYYFEKKQKIYQGLIPTIDTEIYLLEEQGNDLYSIDCDSVERKCFYYVKEEYDNFFKKGPEEVKEKGCLHSNRKVVFLITSAYSMCCDCKADLGDISDEEFKRAVKGVNLRY